MNEIFETLRTERKTDSARACIDVAERLLGDGHTIERVTEARHWVRLSLECDKDSLERRISVLEEKVLGKSKHRATANKLRDRKRAATGGNVVPIRDEV